MSNLVINPEINDLRELVLGVLKIVEVAFKALADKKIGLGDAGLIFEIAKPIQEAIDNVADVKRELIEASNGEFEQAFAEGSAGFLIPDKPELTHDIKGIVKGVLHGYRLTVRAGAKESAV